MSVKTDAMITRQYDAECQRRGMFALRSDARKAVAVELTAQRDELRARLEETHAAVIALSRELSACEMDLKELNA